MDYQKTYKFDNGYGASVVCNFGTYGAKDGLFEVAVLDKDGNIAYNTTVTIAISGPRPLTYHSGRRHRGSAASLGSQTQRRQT
jgi:hypothetical protein